MDKGIKETEAVDQGTAADRCEQKPLLTLGVALRRYWFCLLPLGLLPAFAFLGLMVFHLPLGIIAVLFVAVGLLAMWPLKFKRAPFTFFLVAGGVWMGGGFLGLCVAAFLHFSMHLSM